jgi:hypothetical protein
VWRLKLILDAFASATWLEINFSKSTFVPINVDPVHATSLASVLSCAIGAFPQMYMGLPLIDTKLLAQVLDELTIPVEHCISGWRVQLLNRGGRLTLTNAVISMKPIYAMGALRLPMSIVDRIDKPRHGMLRKGASRVSGSDCQVAWTTTCRLKEEDSLGIVDIKL